MFTSVARVNYLALYSGFKVFDNFDFTNLQNVLNQNVQKKYLHSAHFCSSIAKKYSYHSISNQQKVENNNKYVYQHSRENVLLGVILNVFWQVGLPL